MATLLQQNETSSREERFDALYRQFYPAIYHYLLQLTRLNYELTEDLTQEVFLRMVEKYDERIGPGTSSWLYRVARNLFIDTYRHIRLIGFVPLEGTDKDSMLMHDETVLAFQDMEAGVIKREETSERLQGFRALPEKDQQLMYLEYLGYSTEEIAALMGLHPTAIKTRRWRIRQKLHAAEQEAVA